VRLVVIVVDGSADLVAGVVERLDSSRQMQRSSELANQLSLKAWLSGSR